MNNKRINLIMTIIILGILLILTLILILTKNEKKSASYKIDLLNINYEVEGNEMNLEKYNTENPVVAMQIENYGTIGVALHPWGV